jgi:hypothetical protein
MLVNDEHDTSQGENHILHPSSRQLFRFWEWVRAEKAAPFRDDLDLKRIRHLMPNLFLGEHDGKTGMFRWRLAGTAVCQLFDRELTGTNMLEGWDGFEADVIARFLHGTISAQQPCLLRFRLHTGHKELIGAELAGFPVVSADGRTIHMFGGVFTFHQPSPLGHAPITRLELTAARTIWTEHFRSDGSQHRPTGKSYGVFHVIPGGLSS